MEKKYDLMNYDYDIRKIEGFYTPVDILDDKEMLRLATEYLRNATDRLDSDLDNEGIKEEYNKLRGIIEQLEDIIQHYV